MSQTDYFSNETIREDLRGKTVRGGVYVGAAQALCALISLAAVPFLARLLDPADYGLIAMVAVFTNFARMFVDAGLSMATVQQEKITAAQVSNLFWIATGLGVLVAIVVACLSPVVASIFNEPRLIPITLALTLSYVLSGLTIQHQALLRRRMQFRALAVIQVLSVFLSQVVGIAWAWRRYEQTDDYWALVWIPLVAAAVLLAGVWIACPWRPGRPKRGVGTRKMVGFGANLTGFTFVNYFARQLDKGLIGWKFGDVSLGYYDRAYRLFLTPISQLIGPVSAVALPALSRLTDSPERFRVAYFRILQPLLLVLCPAVFFFMIQAEPIVLLLLGEEWRPSIPIFRTLLIVGIVQPFTNAVSWIMFSHGRSRDILLLGCVGAAIKMLSFLVGLPWGPIGVAMAYSLSGVFIHTPMAILFVTRTGPISARALVRSLLLAGIPSAAVAAVTLAATRIAPGMSPAGSLSLGVGLAMIAWGGVVAIMPEGKLAIEEAKAFVRKDK